MDIFKADDGVRYNAVIDHVISAGDFHAEGFKRAVELLLLPFIDDIDQASNDRDTLILPILALFRHYLELRFKDIIVGGDRLLGRPAGWPWDHDLQQLWERCRKLCEDIYSTDLSDRWDFAGQCVKEFVALDPKCENFRYPLDSHGRAPFEHLVIGLKNLSGVVSKVSDFLDGISMDISVKLQHQSS